MTSIWHLPINDSAREQSQISRARQRAQKIVDLRNGEQLREYTARDLRRQFADVRLSAQRALDA